MIRCILRERMQGTKTGGEDRRNKRISVEKASGPAGVGRFALYSFPGREEGARWSVGEAEERGRQECEGGCCDGGGAGAPRRRRARDCGILAMWG